MEKNYSKTAMELWNDELKRRLYTIQSEPNGLVRESMIDSFLIGDWEYQETEKKQIIDAANQDTYAESGGVSAGEIYYHATFKK